MDIRKNLSIFIHIQALFAFISLASGNSFNSFFIILYLIILCVSLVYDLGGKKYLAGKKLSNFLSLFLVLILGIRAFISGDEILTLIIYFIVFVQIIKLLSKKELRDYEQLTLISFLQVLTGAVITTKILYGILLAAFLLISIATFYLYNIYKEQYEFRPDIKNDLKFNFKVLFGSVSIIWISVFVFSLLVFLFMPRFKGNFLTSSLLYKQQLRTGFSEEIELGRVGEIKKDNSPVMRVKFLDKKKSELPDILYWRGLALDYFDGVSWKQRYKNEKIRFKKNYDGVIVVRNRKPLNITEQEIVAQPIDTNVIFSSEKPVAFKDLYFRNIYSVNNSYFHSGHYTNNSKYKVYSDIYRPGREELLNSSHNLPAEIRDKYTKQFNVSDKISDLSSKLFMQNKTRYENVEKVRDYLIRNLRYTRVLEGGGHIPPLDQFLFEGKEGHCEYFATAMTVILREMGIPSRLVTGFIGGEYNNFGEYFLVRESDAHAWVEVYFTEYGWVTFDPTPGNDTDHYIGFNIITGSLEYLRYRWNRYVVDYNITDQRRILSSLRNRSQKINYSLLPKFSSFGKKTFITLILSLILILFLYNRLKLNFKSFLSEKKNTTVATEIYLNSLKLLKKEGIKKHDHMTPEEFLAYLNKKNYKNYTEFALITGIYNNIKFGGIIDDNLIKRLKSSYKNLKRKSDKKNKQPEDYIGEKTD